MDTLTCVSNAENTVLERDGKHLETILRTCDDKNSPSMPLYCYGTRIDGTTGIFDSFAHCNFTERLSWHYNKFSNSSEECGSLDGQIQHPTPTSSLSNQCQLLLHQAGVSGTGTVTDFSTPTNASNRSKAVSTGGKAGIVIVILLFLAAVITVGYVMTRRGRRAALKNKAVENADPVTVDSADYQKAELPDNQTPVHVIGVLSELEGSELVEVGGGSERVEVVGDLGAVELETHPVAVEMDGQGPIVHEPEASSETGRAREG
jgi:hypothetical protein